MKKKYLIIVFLFVAATAFGLPSTVYAGNINAAEQELINYYSGTFYYEGKAYRATAEAINRATAKLMADNVDLSWEEVAAAKNQIRNSIKQGIDDGYLVEVHEDFEDTETNEDDNAAGEEEDETTGEEKDVPPASKSESEGNIENQTGEDITNPESEKSEESSRVVTTEPEENENTVKGTGEKIDVDTFLKRAKDSTNMVVTDTGEQGGALFIIQDYTAGQTISVKEDGTVLYKGELPIKNTGYQSGKIIRWFEILMGILFCNLAAVIVFIGTKKGDRHET